MTLVVISHEIQLLAKCDITYAVFVNFSAVFLSEVAP